MFRSLALATAICALTWVETLPDAARALDSSRIADAADQAYAHAGPLADAAQQVLFEQGSQLFRQRWVVAPSALGLWGRGPLSNAEVCTDCHANNGRGRPPQAPDEPLRSMLLRLSVGGEVPAPHPVYGGQLQHQGVLGRVPGEGEAYLTWVESAVVLSEGEVISLRRPEIRLAELNYGPIEASTRRSPRLAPAVFGLGLLEAVPESQLLEVAQAQRARGVEGRINRVPELASGRALPGRFGLKANQPSLRQQIAAAAHAELGLTSVLFPEENCTAAQRECRAFPRGATPELSTAQLDALEFYLRLLAAPARRNVDDDSVQQGERLFARAGCNACHVPALRTGTTAALPQLAERTIHPYTDLLLHDLGAALADGRPDFAAGPRDWRTPALWGLGLSAAVNGNAFLLHDGRARSVAEAILWHGGQATEARDAYRAMSRAERAALNAFVDSL